MKVKIIEPFSILPKGAICSVGKVNRDTYRITWVSKGLSYSFNIPKDVAEKIDE